MKLRTSVATVERFQEVFGDQFQTNAPFAKYTSARVGGPADMFVTVKTTAELQTAVELAYAQRVPYFVMGGGSNILVADAGVEGLVIMNRAKAVKYRSNGVNVICTVESGMNLSSLARQCMAKGLGGLEWAVGVPGTVGGAP